MGRKATNCMTAAEGYRRLAALVEALEAAGVVVTGTRVGDDTDGRLPVELRVELPIEDAADVAPWEEHSAGPPTETAADDPLDGRESTEGTGATEDGAGGDRGDDGGDPGDEPVADPDDAAGLGPDASDDRTASDDPDVEAETDADTGGDGSVTACSCEGCEAVFATERGMKIHRTRVHGGDDDRPAHRDTDALREVYARHDTFAEMTEALGVDVTPQAVRQQMIRRGIHDPDPTTDARSTTDADATGGRSPETDGDDDTAVGEPPDGSNGDGAEHATVEAEPDAERGDEPDDGPAAGTDDHEDADTDGERAVDDEQRPDPDPDAPASTAEALDAAFEDLDGQGFGTDLGVDVDVDPRKLAVAVEGSSTLYEVQRELGLGSEETRDVLSAFDLLDLVMGRVATREDREERKVEIPERIRRSLADGAPS